MSTLIATIKGRYEKPKNSNFSEYPESILELVRFYAGKENGRMLQLSTQQADGAYAYLQLTEMQCIALANTLMDAFNYNKYPSE